MEHLSSLAPYHYFLNIRLIWTSYISHKIPDFRGALATLFVFNSLLKFLICRRKIRKDEMSLLNVYHVSTTIGGLSGDADNKVFLAKSKMAQQVLTCRPVRHKPDGSDILRTHIVKGGNQSKSSSDHHSTTLLLSHAAHTHTHPHSLQAFRWALHRHTAEGNHDLDEPLTWDPAAGNVTPSSFRDLIVAAIRLHWGSFWNSSDHSTIRDFSFSQTLGWAF